MKNEIPKILNQLNDQNKGSKIKIRYRKNPSDVYRLYLDYWDGHTRFRENIKVYISGKSKDLVSDKNKLRLAQAIRNKKELQIIENNAGIAFSSSKVVVNFIEFFKNFSKTKKDTNYRISHDHFRKFYKNDFIDIKKINYEISERFMNYLLSLEFTRYTAQHYFAAYKAILNYAVKLRKIEYNPAKTLTIKYERKSIERLTFEELQTLKRTDCPYKDLKNGFLFSCFTGLRISDIRKLTFSDIKDGHLMIIQQKTKTEANIKINETAKQILADQENNQIDKYVFHIPLGGKTSKRLRAWISKAGIQKKITFHCARHTFGCLLIESGADVFTTKKLMAHRDIRTTLQYVEKVDKTQDEAIDKLPIF